LFINSAKIDFDYIVEKLVAFAKSTEGRKSILHITPSNDHEVIRNWHKALSEMLLLFSKGNTVDFPEYQNIYQLIIELEKGIVLSPEDLFNIVYTAGIYFKIKDSISKELYPTVSEYFSQELFAVDLFKTIRRNITKEGFVESSASKLLREIRDKIADKIEKSGKAVADFYREIKKLNYSADDIISVRDGYECVAVKSNYKSMVDGVVVDYSSTGQTAFVVPEVVFKISSELHHLRIEEKAEIRRILTGYCNSLLEYSHQLVVLDRELITFEVLYAKARFGINYNSISPEINQSSYIKIISGIHPMLGSSAVALDIELGNEYAMLIITGPNAGGKTVVIKTVGLFVLMVQSGIPIPASADSSFCIIDELFIDIGDDQSITDSISTFSGHIRRLKSITDSINEKSLVLIDELGGGTDPVEGEAIAESIVEYIHSKKCLSLITTHYSGVKYLATQIEGIQNASMEYDEEKLLPLYKLRTGIPGSSRAFDISVRMGLQHSIIERARSLVNKDFLRTEETIRLLEKERLKMTDMIDGMNKEIKMYEEKQLVLNELIEKYKENDKTLRKTINDKKIDFLRDKRSEFEKIVKELREKKAEKDSIKSGIEYLDSLDNEIHEEELLQKYNIELSAVNNVYHIGDAVIHNESNIKGTIISVTGKNICAQFGALKMNLTSDQITKLNNAVKVQPMQTNYINIVENEVKERTLDLRGMRYDEALRAVALFIDKAITTDVKEIKIIHGIGTGIIRKCIRDYLAKRDEVSEYDYEKTGNSGINYGVTVAYIN